MELYESIANIANDHKLNEINFICFWFERFPEHGIMYMCDWAKRIQHKNHLYSADKSTLRALINNGLI